MAGEVAPAAGVMDFGVVLMQEFPHKVLGAWFSGDICTRYPYDSLHLM